MLNDKYLTVYPDSKVKRVKRWGNLVNQNII